MSNHDEPCFHQSSPMYVFCTSTAKRTGRPGHWYSKRTAANAHLQSHRIDLSPDLMGLVELALVVEGLGLEQQRVDLQRELV